MAVADLPRAAALSAAVIGASALRPNQLVAVLHELCNRASLER